MPGKSQKPFLRLNWKSTVVQAAAIGALAAVLVAVVSLVPSLIHSQNEPSATQSPIIQNNSPAMAPISVQANPVQNIQFDLSSIKDTLASEIRSWISELRISTERVAASQPTSQPYKQEPQNAFFAKIQQLQKEGDTLLAKERYSEAIIKFRTVLELDSNSTDANIGLASALFNNKNRTAAIDSLKNALIKRSDDVRMRAALAVLHARSGETQPALQNTAIVEAAGNYDTTTRELIGCVYLNLNDLQTAESIFGALVRDDPQNTIALIDLAAVHMIRKEFKAAEPLLLRANELSPDTPKILNNLAIVEWKSNNLKSACTRLRRALEIEPDDVTYRVNLARLLVESDEYDKALEQYRFAAALAPQDAGIRQDIGVVLCIKKHQTDLAGC